MNSDHIKPTSQTEWDACPAGTLSSFAKADRRVRSQATIKKAALGAVSTGALLLMLWFGFNKAPQPPGDMGCREVASNLQGYFQGELAQRTEQRVEEHLAHCEKCLRLYERYAGENDLPFDIQLSDLERSSLLTNTATIAAVIP